MSTHDDYIAQASEPLRASLAKLREQIRKYLPDAEEIISYNMPGFAINSKTIVGYAAFSKQCGVYLDPAAVVSLHKEITSAGFKPTKTGITFSPNKPLPDELIKKLVEASRSSLDI